MAETGFLEAELLSSWGDQSLVFGQDINKRYNAVRLFDPLLLAMGSNIAAIEMCVSSKLATVPKEKRIVVTKYPVPLVKSAA